MPSFAKQRTKVLREVFVLTGGDPAKTIGSGDLIDALKDMTRAEAMTAVNQLAHSRFIVLSSMDVRGEGKVSMTTRGIEESERLEKPRYERWPSEHPTSWPIIVSLIVLFAGKFFDISWKQSAPEQSQKVEVILKPAPGVILETASEKTKVKQGKKAIRVPHFIP
jgi:hypothetical protein